MTLNKVFINCYCTLNLQTSITINIFLSENFTKTLKFLLFDTFFLNIGKCVTINSIQLDKSETQFQDKYILSDSLQ